MASLRFTRRDEGGYEDREVRKRIEREGVEERVKEKRSEAKFPLGTSLPPASVPAYHTNSPFPKFSKAQLGNVDGLSLLKRGRMGVHPSR